MRKTWIPALVLAAASAAQAQDAAKAIAPPRIAVIDMSRISGESLLGKSYQTQIDQLKNEIEAQGTKLQAQVQKVDAEIKAMRDELEKQSSVLSQEAADRKQQEIVKKTREREAMIEDGRGELQRMQGRAQERANALNNEFQNRIKPQIDAVAKEKGVDIVLDSQVAILVNKAYDMSQDVIVKADDAERAARGASAARPPATTAAAPKPAASPKP